MKAIRFIFLFVIIYLINFPVISAEIGLEKLDSLVKQRKYNQASLLCEKYLKEDSLNSSVYYNLGSCYFFEGKYGSAVWAFEKSLKLNPKDIDAISNLEVCYHKLNKSELWEPTVSWFERILYSQGSDFWGYLSIALAVIFGLFLYFFLTSKNVVWKKIQLMSASFFFLLLLTAVYITYSSNHYFKSSVYAVIVSQTTPVFLKSQTSEKPKSTLSEGDRVKIISKTKRHYLVELKNKEVVEIEKKGVRRI